MFRLKHLLGTTALFQGEGGAGAAGALAAGAPGSGSAPPAQKPADGAPPPAAAPWGADSNAVWNVNNQPWHNYLPDGHVKAFVQDKNYGNPIQMAEALWSATRMINGNTVEVPKSDAPPEAWKSFHEKLGAFSDPQKYEIKIGEGVKADPRMVDFSKQIAAKHGLTPKQIQGIVDDWNTTVPKWSEADNLTATTARQKADEAELSAVKNKWGAAFDTNVAQGKRVATSLFDLTSTDPQIAAGEKGLLDKINAAIGSTAMMELFARIGAKTAEGTFGGQGGGNTNDPANMSPQTAQAEIDKLNGDTEFQKAYRDGMHPGHAAAVQKMEALYKAARPKSAA